MLLSPQLVLRPVNLITAGGGGGGEATVLFDVATASANAFTTITGATSGTFSQGGTGFTPGSGSNGTSNMVLVAALGFGGSSSGPSVTPTLLWDSGSIGGSTQSMTLIGNTADNSVWLFGLVNPHQVGGSFSSNWAGGGTNSAAVFCASFVNADQTGGSTSFISQGPNTGSSTTALVSTSTSPTTRKFFAGFSYGGAGLFTAAANGTSAGAVNTFSTLSVAGSYDNGTATSMGYTDNSSGPWSAIATAIKGH